SCSARTHPADAGWVREVIAAGVQDTALPPGAPEDPAEVDRWLADGIHELPRSGQGIHLAMATPDGIVGSISVYNADPQTGTAEVGYGVHPEHRGRGYATEALRGLAGHLLGTGVLNKIRLRARPDNIASLRVAEKAGFVKEGVEPGAEVDEDGVHDLVVFGLVREDARP